MRYARFTKPLTIALRKDVYEQIRQMSEQQRISMADVVREMLKKALVASGVGEQLVSLNHKPVPQI